MAKMSFSVGNELFEDYHRVSLTCIETVVSLTINDWKLVLEEPPRDLDQNKNISIINCISPSKYKIRSLIEHCKIDRISRINRKSNSVQQPQQLKLQPQPQQYQQLQPFHQPQL